MAQDDGFTPVGPKRRSRRSKYVVREKTVDDHLADLAEKAEALQYSAVFKAFTQPLEQLGLVGPATESVSEDKTAAPAETTSAPRNTVSAIRCLALGSPAHSANAMYQLAALQLLAAHYTVAPELVSCWDPAFTQEDQALFAKLGYIVSETDPTLPSAAVDQIPPAEESPEQRAATDAAGIVLYYVVHAPPALKETILATNHDRHPPRYAVIGNDLTSYARPLSDAALAEKYPHIQRAVRDIEGPLLKPLLSKPRRKKTTPEEKTQEETKSEEKREWAFHPVAEKLLKNDPWMTAFNDLAVYWKRELED